MTSRDRAVGALVGLAVGDAVGTTLEFKRPGSFTPIDDMVGGGPFDLEPGQWTDDTSMAMCLAESILDVDRTGDVLVLFAHACYSLAARPARMISTMVRPSVSISSRNSVGILGR